MSPKVISILVELFLTVIRVAGPKKRGRRPKSEGDTRARILSSALRVFSQEGLDRATFRQIAQLADVDPALLLHYFDSKEELFFEAIRERLLRQILGVLSEPRPSARVGDRIADAFLTAWDSEEHRPALVALVRAGVSNERIGALLREMFQIEIPVHVARKIGPRDVQLRVGLVASQLIGLAIARHVVRVEAIEKADRTTLVSLIGPALTRYITGTVPA